MEFTSIQSTAAIPVSLHPGGLGYAILNPPSFAIPFDVTEAKPAQGHRQDEPIIRMYDQSAGGRFLQKPIFLRREGYRK